MESLGSNSVMPISARSALSYEPCMVSRRAEQLGEHTSQQIYVIWDSRPHWLILMFGIILLPRGCGLPRPAGTHVPGTPESPQTSLQSA